MPGTRSARRSPRLIAVCLLWPAAAGANQAGANQAGAAQAGAVKQAGCAAIAAEMDRTAPAGAVFIASYPTGVAALRQTAFVYDNALAVLALLACGQAARAERIGAALRIAAAHDRFWHDGRIRNAYQIGVVVPGVAPKLPGWWDAAAGRWDEDAYQVSTATGNVAWAALALLALSQAQHKPADPAAVSMMRWVQLATWVAGPYAGFAGGFYGEEPSPARLGWQSTEHNVDAAAAFGVLARLTGDAGFAHAAAGARGFVGAMWDAAQGRFWLGTGADGKSINRAGSGIDAQLWPLIGVVPAPPDWHRARAWVRAHHAVDGGYGFSAAPDGIWTEGTAQAALILHAPALFAVLAGERGPDGLLYAAAHDRARTGLALSPDSVTDDFYYYHLPHLGATAWSVLAATGTNPFTP